MLILQYLFYQTTNLVEHSLELYDVLQINHYQKEHLQIVFCRQYHYI